MGRTHGNKGLILSESLFEETLIIPNVRLQSSFCLALLGLYSLPGMRLILIMERNQCFFTLQIKIFWYLSRFNFYIKMSKCSILLRFKKGQFSCLLLF